MLGNIGSLILLALLTVVPVKLAAGFVGAGRDNWLIATLAVVVGTVAAVLGYKFAGGNIPGFGVAFLALVASYAIILKTSIGSAFALAFVALFIQIAIAMALASAGLSGLKAIVS